MSGSQVWCRPVCVGVNQSPFHRSLIFISGLESPPRHLDLGRTQRRQAFQVNIHETAARHIYSLQVTEVLPVCTYIRMCPHAGKETKGSPGRWDYAHTYQINTKLSFETNIGPSHLWTCSSTALISAHFSPLYRLATYTHITSSPNLHVSTAAVTHSSTLCMY